MSNPVSSFRRCADRFDPLAACVRVTPVRKGVLRSLKSEQMSRARATTAVRSRGPVWLIGRFGSITVRRKTIASNPESLAHRTQEASGLAPMTRPITRLGQRRCHLVLAS